MLNKTTIHKISTNNTGFSDNPFMMGYDSHIYQADPELGFIFPQEQVVGPKKFVSLDSILHSVKKDDLVILNLGDSSTSGWNSNRVYKGVKNPYAALFTYKTYSQILEEKYKVKAINAGVPGYSSLQGSKYLKRLLKKMARHGIFIDAVTIYFGNNDSTYNQYEDKVRLDYKQPSVENTLRVSPADFKKNIGDMIETARSYGACPIIIIPLINYNRQPGIRSIRYKKEFREALQKLKDSQIKKDLLQAIAFYSQGKLEKSAELDFVLPRIKKPYIIEFKKIARERHLPLIDIRKNITRTSASKYFVDYCHPREKVNEILADKIYGVVKKYPKRKISLARQNDDNFTLPEETYTLH